MKNFIQFGRKGDDWEGSSGEGTTPSGAMPPDKISISIHKNTKNKTRYLCVAFPRVLMDAAGLRRGDKVLLKWKEGIACIVRSGSECNGLKISGHGGNESSNGKLRIVAMFDGVLEKRFFPVKEERYSCSVHETRPNMIEFAIGEAS